MKEGNKALSKEPITPTLVQKLMCELAVKASFVNKNMNGNAINPVSPHALRESFSSIMIGKGVPRTVVDFWLGHEIGDMPTRKPATKTLNTCTLSGNPTLPYQALGGWWKNNNS